MQDFDTLPCSCNCTGAPQPTGLSPSRFAPSRFTLTTPRPKPRCGAVGPTVPKANRHLRSGSNTLTRESSSKGISAQETITNQALPVGSKKPHPENKRGAGGFAAPMTRALASMVRSIDIAVQLLPSRRPAGEGPITIKDTPTSRFATTDHLVPNAARGGRIFTHTRAHAKVNATPHASAVSTEAAPRTPRFR